MKFPPRRELDSMYQDAWNHKHEHVTNEREPRVHSIDQSPRQTDVIHRSRLPRVGPQSGHWFAMEDDEAHLGEVGCNEEQQSALYGQRQAVMELTQPTIEGQT